MPLLHSLNMITPFVSAALLLLCSSPFVNSFSMEPGKRNNGINTIPAKQQIISSPTTSTSTSPIVQTFDPLGIIADDEHSHDDLISSEALDRRSFLIASAALLTSTTAIIAANPQEANAADSASATTAARSKAPLTAKEVFAKASKKAISGGRAGASASIVQVLSLMWLRTSMNYQYRYGGTLSSSLSALYGEGGIRRLYQGLPFALVQGPATRFGDTAANVGILALLDSVAWAEGMPLPLRTLCGSITAGVWRIFLMPIDTSKTVMQVEGKDGLTNLYDKVKETGPGPLYRGALASAAATAVGHFPWFLTYNFLNEVLPMVEGSGGSGEKDTTVILLTLGRAAFTGFAASCVSDCASNSLRVIKTTKQTAGTGDDTGDGDMSYGDAVGLILEKDGWAGLFGRGLQTRLLTNALQGAAFSVLWRYFQEVQS